MSHFVPTESGMIHVMTGAGTGDMALGGDVPWFGILRRALQPHDASLAKRSSRNYFADAPGHGQSSTPPDEQTHEDFQDSLNRAVASLITGAFVVVFGNSMGGFIGVRFALAHPDKVKIPAHRAAPR